MKFGRTLIISLVLLGITPGLGELMGNSARLIQVHLFQANLIEQPHTLQTESDHAHDEGEHGCAECGHQCHCSSSFLTVTPTGVPLACAVWVANHRTSPSNGPESNPPPPRRPPIV